MKRVSDEAPAATAMTGWIRRVLSLDLRSLACFRVGLGCLLVANIESYRGSYDAFFGVAGVWPLERAAAFLGPAASLGLWPFGLPAALYEQALPTLVLAAGVALILGWWTRAVCAGAWLLLASMYWRSVGTADYGDELLVRLLFWSAFLPLGARWSLAAWARRSSPPAEGGGGRDGASTAIASVASAGLLLQIALVYFVAGGEKTSDEWVVSGTAMADLFAQDYWARPAAAAFRDLPELLRVASLATPWFEVSVPILLLASSFFWKFRMGLVGMLVSFHCLLGLTLGIGASFLVSIVAALALVPSGFWELWQKERAPAVAQANRATSLHWVLVVPLLLILVESVRGPFPIGSERSGFGGAAAALRLDQPWPMFSRVGKADGWVRVRVVRADGGEIDLLRGGAPTLALPQRRPWAGPTHRWALFFRSVGSRPEVFGAGYVDWQCRAWNRGRAAEGRARAIHVEFVRLDRTGERVLAEVAELYAGRCGA